jgi:endonuclease/exonuclease/phosphatase family metal-dependent hydrolase
MRIATWNLERPSAGSWKIVPRQRARLAAVDADVWVLTETRASIGPEGFHAVHSPVLEGWSRDEDERMISLWSRWPIRPTALTPDPRTSLSALVATPTGPLLVYGSVLPWANDTDPGGTARMWERHAATIPVQGEEWRQLRAEHPGVPLVLAGDLNQSRDGSDWYGTHRVRDLLTTELEQTGLQLLTGFDVVAAGVLDRPIVDHIAATPDLADLTRATVSGLPVRDDDGVRLSDHPTVIVDVAL